MELISHYGWARILSGEISTPAILDYKCREFVLDKFTLFYPGSYRCLDSVPKRKDLIYPDESVNYSVPKEIAEESVKLTLDYLKKEKEIFGGVINGGKYPELRKKCAKGISEKKPKVVMIANSRRLLQDPRALVQTLVNVRDSIDPKTLVFFPEPTPYSLPLLSLLGVDLFSYLGVRGVKRRISLAGFIDSEKPEIENRALMECLLRQTLSAIREGKIERLAESACSTDPYLMSALRILYREHGDWYEPLVPSIRIKA